MEDLTLIKNIKFVFKSNWYFELFDLKTFWSKTKVTVDYRAGLR